MTKAKKRWQKVVWFFVAIATIFSMVIWTIGIGL
jgi:hypothetical protein